MELSQNSFTFQVGEFFESDVALVQEPQVQRPWVHPSSDTAIVAHQTWRILQSFLQPSWVMSSQSM